MMVSNSVSFFAFFLCYFFTADSTVRCCCGQLCLRAMRRRDDYLSCACPIATVQRSNENSAKR